MSMQIIILSSNQISYRVNADHIVGYHRPKDEQQTVVQMIAHKLYVDQTAEEIDKLLGVDPCDTPECSTDISKLG